MPNYDRGNYEKVYVFLKTPQQSFEGYLHRPRDPDFRFSDYLNSYDLKFICLTEVRIFDHTHEQRLMTQQDFVAVAVNSIVFIMPVDPPGR